MLVHPHGVAWQCMFPLSLGIIDIMTILIMILHITTLLLMTILMTKVAISKLIIPTNKKNF